MLSSAEMKWYVGHLRFNNDEMMSQEAACHPILHVQVPHLGLQTLQQALL